MLSIVAGIVISGAIMGCTAGLALIENFNKFMNEVYNRHLDYRSFKRYVKIT
jgi:uncharacterized BrkB/YihY/UPF0761 family membrane protein